MLEVLARANHPVGIVTKSALVAARHRHPRADGGKRPRQGRAVGHDARSASWRAAWSRAPATPARRLDAMRRLAEAGIPTAVMVAPIIPSINDCEIEAILDRAQAMGAREAGYVMLRLPLEVRDLFAEWLMAHYPGKLRHVLSLVRSVRDGKMYDSTFGKRMTGSGPYAWMIGRRFEAAAARLGLSKSRIPLRCDLLPAAGAARRAAAAAVIAGERTSHDKARPWPIPARAGLAWCAAPSRFASFSWRSRSLKSRRMNPPQKKIRTPPGPTPISRRRPNLTMRPPATPRPSICPASISRTMRPRPPRCGRAPPSSAASGAMRRSGPASTA